VPILIIVLIGGFFFSIIDAIIDFIKAIIRAFIQALIDFLRNPIGWVQEKWATFKNWLATSFINADMDFDPYEYENQRTDPTICIKQSDFETMQTNLDKMVNRNVAGLDDIMLKKMLLAYYRGTYLDDTNVLIELTKEDLRINEDQWMSYMKVTAKKDGANLLANIATDALLGAGAGAMIGGGPGAIVGAIAGAIAGIVETPDEVRVLLSESGKQELMEKYEDEIYPFEIVGGDTEAGRGEDGFLYLSTTGMVKIYDACSHCETSEDDVDCSSCEKIIYYEEETLDAIYNEHYLKTLLKNEEYANSVLDYLKKCYTYTTVGSTTEYNGDVATSYSTTSNLSDAIKMYSLRTTEQTQATWEYVNESKEASKPKNPIEWAGELFGGKKNESRERNLEPTDVFPIRAQYIQYSNKVAEYATPVEFMVDLLEIVGSRDFVDAFIETVGNGTYIKLKLYTIESTTVTNTTEQKQRHTTVYGKRTYRVSLIERDPAGDEGWTSYIAGAYINTVKTSSNGTEKVTVNLHNHNEGDKYKVRLYVNDIFHSDKTMYFDEDGFLWFDIDNTESSWTFNMPGTNTWTDSSEVVESSTVATTEKKYDIGITKIKTWYATITANNVINRTITAENQQGTEASNRKVEILRISNVEGKNAFDSEDLFIQMINLLERIQTISYSDPPDETFTTDSHSNIFTRYTLNEIENQYITRRENAKTLGEYDPYKDVYTEEECLNVQFNWALQKGTQEKTAEWYESSYNYNDYIIHKMQHSDSSVQKLTLYSNYFEELSEGLAEGRVTVDYDERRPFLGLLSNAYGYYVKGAAFKPKSNAANSGKLVEYNDLTGGKSKVGELLENGSAMLYTLLEESERTQGLVDIMKYMMYEYTNNNYSVTEFNFYIFKNESFATVN